MQNSFNDKMRKMIINEMGMSNECTNQICMRMMENDVHTLPNDAHTHTHTTHRNYFNNIFCLFEIRMKTMMLNDEIRAKKKASTGFMFNFS